MTYVSYLRVSTARQGVSGLGLEAQREIIARAMTGSELVAEFVEVESGRKSDRPQLAAALAVCKERRACLVVAKLDRLARNLCFLTQLLESGVDIKFCDYPAANKMVLHIIGAIAQYEAELTATRTRQALAAKKARGEQLGRRVNFDLYRARAIEAAGAACRRKAEANDNNRRARAIVPLLAGMTLQQRADYLNANGYCTAHGKPFQKEQVRRLMLI